MEIEIKVRVKDLNVIRHRLNKLGARRIKKVHQIDAYYSLYRRPFTRTKGSVVRVRHNKNEGRTFFEYDWAVNNMAAHEIEVEVNDWKKIQYILKLMKARKEMVVDKQREYYKKGRLEIVLDKVKGLGSFVEVEIQGRDTPSNRKKIIDFLKKLEVDKKDFLMDSRYCQMLLNKKGKKHAYF